MSGEDEKPDDPVQRDPVQEELLTRLDGVGLCSEYWLPKLRDKLGVTSLQALKHLQYEDYLKLECEVEHPWEKRALQQLLKLRGSKTTMKQLQEERLERLQKKQEKAKLALEELKEMQESGRSRQEEEVKCKEEQLWGAMDVPREYWVSSEKPLVEVIENMQKQLNVLEESVSKGENIPDEEVLRRASGGLALQGIYRTDKLEDMLEKRELLITVPDGFKLSGPEQGSLFETKAFSSSRAESTFTKTMEKLGFSTSVAAKGGFGGFSAETSTDYSTASEHEETHRSRSEHMYICTAKYNYIPLASCYFPKDQLRLSNAALQELTGIEQLLSRTPEPDRLEMLKSRCGGFFTRFGSHVNQGPLHFGGIFWWKASSEGFRAEQLDEVKKQTSDALNSYVGGSFMDSGFSVAGVVKASMSNSAASFQGTGRENQETKIQLFVTKTGGPHDVDTLARWKSELVMNNKTWCVIDRGLQLIPVWDIILANHRQDFADVHQVSNSLRAAYTALTNQSTSPLFGEGLISAVDEAKAFLEDLKTWHVTGDEEQLLKLMDFKQKLNERTKDYSVWISVCLSDKGLQDFLEKTVSLCRELPAQNTFSIRSRLRCLLDPHVYSVKNFPRSSLIMQWVFHTEDACPNPVSVSDFSALTETLQQMKSYIQEVTYEPLSSAETIQEAKVKATTHVSLALSSLLEGLRERAQTDTELLLLSIAASTGYQVESHTFQHLLGSPDINFMLREMQT
ncbi:interferon-induced very large GTPase 1-like, partial [Alligator sinensis]|uniref:Interferon-induced very large GTPase 1-like n=1 Tax=Alligator sinensis TaxID=38654 RepID=A0A3Q0FUQ5_ALLSI